MSMCTGEFSLFTICPKYLFLDNCSTSLSAFIVDIAIAHSTEAYAVFIVKEKCIVIVVVLKVQPNFDWLFDYLQAPL